LTQPVDVTEAETRTQVSPGFGLENSSLLSPGDYARPRRDAEPRILCQERKLDKSRAAQVRKIEDEMKPHSRLTIHEDETMPFLDQEAKRKLLYAFVDVAVFTLGCSRHLPGDFGVL
jgi:hypothetical protein